ncbi:MAG TPA: insulinase family protein, partial [Limnochordia bacterium]
INLLQALYHVNPVRIDIGGTVDSIRQITKELLYTCYGTFYHPQNMAVFAVGDFDAEAVLEQVRRDAADRSHARREEISRSYPDEPPGVREHRVEDELVISRPRLALGFKDRTVGLSGEALLRRELATNVVLRLCLGRSSPLFSRLYDLGLIDDHFSGRYSGAVRFGHTVISGETPDPERLYEELITGLERLRQEGVRRDDFERVRRQYIGSFLDAFNSLEFIANGFLSNHFRGISLFDYVEAVDALTLDELNARLQEHFDRGQAAVSILWPKGKRG